MKSNVKENPKIMGKETKEIKTEVTDKLLLVKAITIALLSFLFVGAKIFSMLSPFAIAFLCALPSKYLVTSLIGSIAGIIALGHTDMSIYYIIGLFTIFAIKIFVSKMIKGNAKPFFLSTVSLIVMGGISIAYILIKRVATYDAINIFFELVLTVTMTYFFSKAITAILKKNKDKPYTYTQLCCISILFIASIIALCGVHIFNINLGVILSVVAILMAIQLYGISGGAVLSILVFISLNLYSFEFTKLATLIMVASFISGIFFQLNKVYTIAIFIGVSTFYMVTMGAPIVFAYHLIEIFFACAIYVILPIKSEVFNIKNNTLNQTKSLSESDNQLKYEISSRLNFAGNSLKDLNYNLIAVSKKFSEVDGNNIATIYDVASRKVCKGCSMQLSCWDNDYDKTMKSFLSLNKKLYQNSSISEEEMPSFFQENCCKVSKLVTSINDCYKAFLIKENARKGKIESRCFAVEQFNSIANVLCEISGEISNIENHDVIMSQKLSIELNKNNCKPTQVICYKDRLGKTNIEIYLKNKNISDENICKICCDLFDKEFDLPSVCEVENSIKVSLFEKAKYTVDYFCQQHISNENFVCGDSFTYFSDSKGNSYMLLSDGMGSGKRAAIDSVMTCSIIEKIIKSGFSTESAIKLINSSLLLKSTDESLATIDIVKFDLYSGKAEFLKAGAAASYVLTRNGGVKINAKSLPIGILQDISLDKKIAKLQDDDIICLVSDGVCDNGDDWILPSLQKLSHLSSKEISTKMLYEAKHRLPEDFRIDDMTFMVAKISS